MSTLVDLRVGIDVGGTNTDAVVLDRQDELLAKVKCPTTADVTSGIRSALESVLDDPAVDNSRITHVMLGTTHATNALLQRRGLLRVGVLRIGAPATVGVSPLQSWPDDLRERVCAGSAVVRGGFEIDGREIVPFDEPAVRDFFREVAGNVDAVAVTGVFSPVLADQELAARRIAHDVLGDVHVSLGHEIGTIGLIERENATALNSALVAVAGEVAHGLTSALTARGVKAATYFAQNDGTLMSLEYAVRFPIFTVGSGPACSIRGAAFLSGVQDALVIDVGGTSSDIGVLTGGYPRESALDVEIGGVRTNFRMPDLVSIAVGGGTIVRLGPGGETVLGPDSVGYRVTSEALVHGGTTPTLTDAMVLAGRADFGDGALAAGAAARLRSALCASDAAIAAAADRVRVARADVHVVAVGGGSRLVPDDLPGSLSVQRPEHAEVANAVGAAIAVAGGQFEQVVRLDGVDRAQVLERVAARARERAIRAGADPTRITVLEREEIPLAYQADPAVRVRVKAAGPLA